MFKKLNSKFGLTFLVVIALLAIAIGFVLSTADSDSVKSARQNAHGTLVESDDVVVERAGNWTTQDSASASGGNYLYSSGSPDDVLTLTFVGSRVEVIYTSGANLGTLAVDVDRSVLRTVITAEQSTQYQESTVVDYLDDGLHTLRVYAQAGGVIGIDAFRVSRSTQEAMIVNENKLMNGVLDTVRSEANICIEVSLQDPQPNFGEVAGEQHDFELIAQIQDQVLTNIEMGNFELIAKYTITAGFAGYADLWAILDLQRNPLVRQIRVACLPIEPAMGQSVPVIQADLVKSAYGITGEGMVVAIIDHGVDINHPDLGDDIIAQRCFSVYGLCTTPSADDVDGHGTEMAGIITSNGVTSPAGTTRVGVAPDAKIVAIRVDTDVDVQLALGNISGDPALQGTIDVLNLSFSFGSPFSENCDFYYDQIAGAINILRSTPYNVKVFAASGNQGLSNQIAAPACITGVIAVGATYDGTLGNEPDTGTYFSLNGGQWPVCSDNYTNDSTITCFTNRSTSMGKPDMLAPGTRIIAPYYDGTDGSLYDGAHPPRPLLGVGTSEATAHASAVGILVDQAAENPLSDLWTPPQITSVFRSSMRSGAAATTDSNGNIMPFPLVRINAFTAVQSVLPDGQNPYSPVPAPHNDSFPGHQLPYAAVGVPTEYIQDPFGATTSVYDPIGNQLCGLNYINNTVWFSYSTGSTQHIAISTTDSTFDTALGVYTGTLGNFSLVACSDEISFRNTASAVNFTANGGVVYYIMMANTGSSFVGPSGLHLWITGSGTTPNQVVEAGDTLALFGTGKGTPSLAYGPALPSTTGYANLIDTKQDAPYLVNYATFPVGVQDPVEYPPVQNPVEYPPGVTNASQWVMGDWDGDGLKTPGVYILNGPSAGVFYTTNITGTVNNIGQAVWRETWFGFTAGAAGNFAVAGRFNLFSDHDCIGVIDSANFPPYGVAFALYFTCNMAGGDPPKTFQWLSVLLPDSQGFSGPFEFEAGDFGSLSDPNNRGHADWIDTIACRRGDYIAFTNTPPTTLEALFPLAQYFPAQQGGTSHFVVGDWDSNNLDYPDDVNNTDSFGLYYNGGNFYYQNTLAWSGGQVYQQTGIDQRITPLAVTSWRRN